MIRLRMARDYASILEAHSHALSDDRDLDSLIDSIADARIVMLGEASHGTSEFYTWRDRISRRLIEERGFSFIAVEGDWPDCQRVHRHITGGEESAESALAGYRRFPTWMWGNEEVLELVHWLREFNEKTGGTGILPVRDSPGLKGRATNPRPIGFHGLDVYSLHDSMRLVIDYLERVDPPASLLAKRAYACFEPFGEDAETYARATRYLSTSCEEEVRNALIHMQQERLRYSGINPDHTDPGEAYFDATMNARVTQNAEAYYRAMLGSGAQSWNIRDRHMMDTLNLLLDFYGRDARAIVWEHNTHIGDYRGTDMLRAGYVNIGGLAREQHGDDKVFLLGFATHSGSVMAADEWGEPGREMDVPEAPANSLEGMLHEIGRPSSLILLRAMDAAERRVLSKTVGHRAIGVVYHPEYERPGNYVPTRLADRYDGLAFVDQTAAVHPLGIPADLSEEPEAYPTGL
jgi:erythromycin esterase